MGPRQPLRAKRRGTPCAILLGLLLGVIQAVESNPSRTAICPGYPDVRREPQGQIRSPSSGVMISSSCSWVIVGGPDDIIYIGFQDFFLPCRSEMLIIRAPNQPSRKLCGYTPESIRIKGGNVSLTYSWKFWPRNGFQLKYRREPKTQPLVSCNRTLDDFYGVIYSPAFSSDSQMGAAHCQWVLDAHDSRPLILRFTVLNLDIGDSIQVYDGVPGAPLRPHLLRNLDYTSNNKIVSVDSPSSRAWVVYQAVPGTEGRGFNATYHVQGFCVPWDFPCGGDSGEGATCYSTAERCDGNWDCANGSDEDGCHGCPPGQYPCGGGRGIGTAACYGPADRCNYQTFCADAADERRCYTCQPGNFRCRDGRCIYESWVCDGQADCVDTSDEADCSYILPRKVVTAAVIGSLVCGLLLVIALGCTCRLYALRSHEFGVLAPMSRMEAQLVQRQAPPSYGQLIARGVIPPVEGFPVEHPNQNSVLGNLRSLLHLLRRDPASPAGASRGRRPHQSRFMRRLTRRMRRLGLLPPPASSASSSTTASTVSPNAAPALDDLAEPSRGDGDASSQLPEDQAPPLPVKVPPVPAEPIPDPPVLRPTPRFTGVMRNLRVRLFSPTPTCSAESGEDRSMSPPPDDEDEVLLVPLADPPLQNFESWNGDDEPLLT